MTRTQTVTPIQIVIPTQTVTRIPIVTQIQTVTPTQIVIPTPTAIRTPIVTRIQTVTRTQTATLIPIVIQTQTVTRTLIKMQKINYLIQALMKIMILKAHYLELYLQV